MADNVAQSIKNLQTSLEALDSQLLKSQKGATELGNMIQKAMVDSGVSVDEFLKHLRNTVGAKKENKISLVLELTDAKGRPLTAASIQSEISALTSSGKNPIRRNELKELQKIMGDPVKLYDDLNRVVNEFLTKQRRLLAEQQRIDAQRVRSAQETAKILTIEKGRLALKGLESNPKLNAAVQQQLKYMQEIRRIGKDINTLQSNKHRNEDENYILAQRKKQLKEILTLQQELNNKQPYSANIARTIDKYNQLRGSVRSTNEEIKRTKTSLESMLPTLRRLAAAFGVTFSIQGLVQFGKKLVETRGEFELQQVAMRSILQNKQLADEIWDKTMQAALQSPFTAMQLTRYTKQLAAYRIETDKLFDTTKRLADVSAGLGVDMQRLILAYGQVKAANYLRASEIRQFTEAGVNILGELSKYFTDTQGKMVSTAQVMDMVQKRMVKFEDVEEIFKRLTDQGGIFYNMQYIQSQTVKGQINKLHDAYDQMMNSIGKSNEGKLKVLTSLLLNIVQNWREWKTVLDSIAWPLLTLGVYKFAKGLLYANAALITTNKNVNFLTRAGARLQLMFKNLWATISANPMIALATALFVVGDAIWNHAKAVRDVNKEYNELIKRNYETMSNLELLSDQINKNNEVLKNSKKPLKERNAAQKENQNILSKLQTEYPELANQMSINTKGVIDMKDALEKYNAELRLQIRLQELSKAGFFDQSFDKDVSQFESSFNKREEIVREAINSLNVDIQYYRAQLQKTVDAATRKQIEDLLASMVAFRNDVNKAIAEGSSAFDAYNKFAEKYKLEDFEPYKKRGRAKRRENEVNNELQIQTKEYSAYLIDILRTSKDFTYDMNDLITLSENDFIKKHKDQIQKELYTTQKDGTIVIGELGEALSEAFYKTASKVQTPAARETLLKMLISDWEKQTGLTLKFGRKTIENSNNETLDLDSNKSRNYDSISSLISLLKEMNSEYDKLSKSAYGFAKSNEKVKESFTPAFKEIFGFAGIDISQVDTTSKKSTADAMKFVMDKLDANKQWGRFGKDGGKKARQEFVKAWGEMAVEADIELTTRTRENVAKQLEDAFGDYQLTLDLQKLQLPSGLLTDMFDIDAVDLAGMRKKLENLSKRLVDKNGVMTGDNLKLYEDWLKKLDDEERKLQQQRLKDYSKYLEYQLSDRAKLEMEYVKKVAEVQSELAYNDSTRQRILDGLRKEYDEKLAKQDWEDFKGSEMYVEMMEDLTKQGTAALEEMRKKLLEVRDNAENLSPRALKEVIKALEKIDETIYGRMSPFQAVRELRKAARGAMNENGVLDISEAFERDANAKKEYEEHRKRREVIEENIADMQREQDIIDSLNRTRSLSIDALRKEQEVYHEQRRDYEKKLDKLGIETKENQKEYQETEKLINQFAAKEASLEKEIKLRTELQSIQDKLAKSEYKGMSLDRLSSMSKEELDAMGLSEAEMKDMGEILKYWKLMRQAEIKALEEAKNYLSIIQSIGKNTADMLHTLGVEQNPLSDYWEQATDSAFNYTIQTIDAIKQFKEAQNAMEASGEFAKNLMTGNWIKLILQLLGVLIQVITTIAKHKDAQLNKIIEDEQERIDQLTMAYERLEKSIERTLTTASYMLDMSKMVQNINAQISATEQQLAAARSRKSVDNDEVRGYEKSLQDLYNQLDELQQKQIEVFGGIGRDNYRSWAEGFVDAWKSAFLETGDGLDALQDHFDEFLQEWFVKQATMRIAAKALEPMMKQIDESVSGGDVDLNRLWQIKEQMQSALEQLNIDLTEFAGMWDFGGEGGLSGLAAGIQGMTEEQANILEAYWNSVRAYTASIDMNVARIAEALGVGGPNNNPMIEQLIAIANNTAYIRDIHTLLVNSQSNLGQGKGFITYSL